MNYICHSGGFPKQIIIKAFIVVDHPSIHPSIHVRDYNQAINGDYYLDENDKRWIPHSILEYKTFSWQSLYGNLNLFVLF